MKKFSKVLVFVLAFISFATLESKAQCLSIEFAEGSELGGKRNGCKGFRFGCVKIKKIAIGVSGCRIMQDTPKVAVNIQILNEQLAKLEFASYGVNFNKDTDKSVFEIEEDMVIMPEMLATTEYKGKTIILKAGSYKSYEEKGLTYVNVRQEIR